MEDVRAEKDAKPWQWIGIALLVSAWAYFLFAVDKMPDAVVGDIKQPPAPVAVSLSQAAPAQSVSDVAPEPESKPEQNKMHDQSGNPTGKRGEAVKINATYEDRNQVFNWLLKNGGRILMLDAQGYLLAEANEHGKLQKAGNAIGKGKLRQATADIAAFMQVPLPDKTKYAAVWWPNGLWNQILLALKAYEAHSATIAYRVADDTLLVTIRQVVTTQGIISPGQVVRIKQER